MGGAFASGLRLLGMVAGAGLLIAAEPLVLSEIRVDGRAGAEAATTAGAHHGWALAVLGVALTALGSVAVLRGSRAAAASALLVAVIAAWIVVGLDRPSLDDTGLVRGPGALARASAGPAWRVEVAGAALALVGAAWASAAAAWCGPPRRRGVDRSGGRRGGRDGGAEGGAARGAARRRGVRG